ncbi:MAG: hypothetical protein HKN82_01975 [Akkermansiaceae bacterium]|nr:hypothetical protein [Akkermansiaceae bacterium]NNM29118.1 hypothetical protein [Akkermansiaceae bacterium]
MKHLFPILLLALGAGASPASIIYSGSGNGDTGFGGAVGNGSLTFDYDGGTSLAGTFSKGGGSFDNLLVIYFDTVAGGFSDTGTFADNGDDHRRAISGFDGGTNRSTLSMPAGFNADYAVAINSGFAGVWTLDNTNNFTFNDDLGVTNDGTNFSFSLDLADIGIAFGDSAEFVTTYISNSGFRSTESLGNDVSGTQGWNAFSASPAQSFVAVPEASEALIVLLGMTGLLATRRRKG